MGQKVETCVYSSYSCTLASSTGRNRRLTTLNYLLNPRLEVLDLQLKHDHALLGLGDVLHPVVVGSALNMDELALMAFSGGDLHSHKGGVVVASSHLALALVGEVFNGEASVSREVCEPILQSLLIGGIATPAVDVDIVGGVSALSFDVLLNFREDANIRIRKVTPETSYLGHHVCHHVIESQREKFQHKLAIKKQKNKR